MRWSRFELDKSQQSVHFPLIHSVFILTISTMTSQGSSVSISVSRRYTFGITFNHDFSQVGAKQLKRKLSIVFIVSVGPCSGLHHRRLLTLTYRSKPSCRGTASGHLKHCRRPCPRIAAAQAEPRGPQLGRREWQEIRQ